MFIEQPLVSLLVISIAIVIFAVFDVIGFYYILTKKIGNLDKVSKIANGIYRIIQTSFQAFLVYLLYTYFSLDAAIGFILLWWFGVADLLYYKILKEDFLKYDGMKWIWWTPLGLWHKLTDKPAVRPEEFYDQARDCYTTIIVFYIVFYIVNYIMGP